MLTSKYFLFRIYLDSRNRVIYLKIALQLCFSIHVGKCMIFQFVWERLELNSENNENSFEAKKDVDNNNSFQRFLKMCYFYSIFPSLSINTLFNLHVGRTTAPQILFIYFHKKIGYWVKSTDNFIFYKQES